LRAVEVAVRAGETDATTLLALVAQQLGSPAIRVDYVALVDPVTLLPLTSVQQRALLAIAAWIGNTRLIDNVLLSPEAPEGQA
ncbi:MAG: pantoate--beta-alanine ligase, partial [Rhodospirillales bacterium]|nr:pantoate--beta-alanine ligase [Acetobacter sp.]